MIAAGAAAEQESIDLSVSYTSGPAAEAAAAAMAKRDMLSHAEDGTPYWGALDNDSARSRAAGQTLVIDQWECIQCGTCVENTEQVFALPDDARAVVYRQEGPMELIQDAIDACPVTCIHWTDNPEQYEQLNDIEGHPIGDAA
jgi:ferredoxin